MMTRTNPQPATPPAAVRMKSEISLAAVATAVDCSSLFVRDTLRQWRLAHLTEVAERLVAELVAAAVNTTGISNPSPRWMELTGLAMIQVRVVVLDRRLIVEVWDCDTNAPTLGSGRDKDAGSSRGLLLVQSLSDRWSFYRPEGGGKWVWCELNIDQPRETSRPLPQRERQTAPVPAQDRPIGEVPDLDLIQRVRDGLKQIGRASCRERVYGRV